jgi:hypothetical protein
VSRRLDYVAPNGDDGNSGSESAPWRTLQKTADSAGPGTDVIVLPGMYVGFRARNSGGVDAPIRFVARPGAVVTNGDSEVTIVEILIGVSSALTGEPLASRCPSLDIDGNGTASIDEIIIAVANALTGCGNSRA